ncbi:hypothetical protein K431DRAFT_91751 [Polychaeton citri CBS 116435]|uniref:Uncharacterized protein n=1 Tax=Polychaeton citri CBS 116435 TaxID=1314669 RepID=A0A9P4Q6I5_9PEZI|nr:hypothetical protein K431DRAFT_91751 [Polychaeton citri CBS 116435]
MGPLGSWIIRVYSIRHLPTHCFMFPSALPMSAGWASGNSTAQDWSSALVTCCSPLAPLETMPGYLLKTLAAEHCHGFHAPAPSPSPTLHTHTRILAPRTNPIPDPDPSTHWRSGRPREAFAPSRQIAKGPLWPWVGSSRFEPSLHVLAAADV